KPRSASSPNRPSPRAFNELGPVLLPSVSERSGRRVRGLSPGPGRPCGRRRATGAAGVVGRRCGGPVGGPRGGSERPALTTRRGNGAGDQGGRQARRRGQRGGRASDL